MLALPAIHGFLSPGSIAPSRCRSSPLPILSPVPGWRLFIIIYWVLGTSRLLFRAIVAGYIPGTLRIPVGGASRKYAASASDLHAALLLHANERRAAVSYYRPF